MSLPSTILRSQAGTRSLRRLPAITSSPASVNIPALLLPPSRGKTLTTTATTDLSSSPPPQFGPALWFQPSSRFGDIPGQDPIKKSDQERKVKLGTTLRILQDRLPTLLQKPLPQDILAPNISLHLFPSTHPHLPVVSGKVAYVAALWTSPIAWNRIPLISNCKIDIISERITTQPQTLAAHRENSIPEQLVVRWKTVGQGRNWNLKFMGTANPEGTSKKEFEGLFIFEFDKEGRILSHTIENLQDGGEKEKVSKVVGLTDWLLGGMQNPAGPGVGCHKPDLK